MRDSNWTKFNRLVTGPSGSGKTTLAVEMFCAEHAARKVVFDSQFEVAGKLGVRPVRTPGDYVRALAPGGVVVFQPGDEWPSVLHAFRWFYAATFHACDTLKGRTLAYCDELQDFAPQGTQDRVPAEFMQCLEKGRRRQLDLLCSCQSASRVNLAIRAQLTELLTFCQVEKNALEFTRGFEIQDQDVRGLGRFQWLMRNGQTGEVTLGGPRQSSRVETKVTDQRGRGAARPKPAAECQDSGRPIKTRLRAS